MPKKDMTAGESLCTFIKKNVLVAPLWTELELKLACCGRGSEWVAFMEEVVATQMTGRLVTAGVSIANSLGGAKGVDDYRFIKRLNSLVSETMDASLPRPKRQKLFDSVVRAILSTYGNVSAATRTIIEREAGRPPRCFLCNRQLVMIRGPRVLDLSLDEQALAVEDEHIWPRSYGGDSIEANMALACHSCNRNKANFANWSMVDIQSLVLGLPSDDSLPNSLRRIPGWQRYAMTSLAAHTIANRDSVTLKVAYYDLRSRVLMHPRVRRTADVADFFNLVHHIGDD